MENRKRRNREWWRKKEERYRLREEGNRWGLGKDKCCRDGGWEKSWVLKKSRRDRSLGKRRRN